MVLDLDIVFKFGKYKGELVSTVVQMYPDYIGWVIGNVEDLQISPNFFQKAVRLNPDFDIPKEHNEIFEKKVFYFMENHHYILASEESITDFFDEESIENLLKNKNYKKRPILTKREIANAKNRIKNLFIKKLEEVEQELKNDAIRAQQEKNRYDNDRAEYDSIMCSDDFVNNNDDTTDWTNYNDDNDWDQQSDLFWNQF